jgi:hypothetical protein
VKLEDFREIVAIDFEFIATSGERPKPICLAARELRSGRSFRIWQDQFGPVPPYAFGSDVLFVAYYASAELGCYRTLAWPTPVRILDLFVEFRARTNGRSTPTGSGLLGALTYFGLDGMGAGEKDEMRELILSSGPWSSEQRQAILNYCAEDVDALARLLPAMEDKLDLPRALLRGRYMAAAAAMEHHGVPIDRPMWQMLRERWTDIQDDLIAAVDRDYGVYDGRTFKADRFAHWLSQQRIPWPLLASGHLDLSDDTFRSQAPVYPQVAALRELRSSLSDLRLNDLAVGHDGRNRTILSAFRTRSGRNAPSNAKFIFGPSTWLRALIKPPPGHGLAYIDYAQQEIGIAAALSGDRALQEAYRSGDCYLAFAKQAGAVPQDATKETHGPQRELFKQCSLAVNYGMEAPSLALRIASPQIVARNLLRAHHQAYRTFWSFSDAVVDHAMLFGVVTTMFGWPLWTSAEPNPRSLRNFPMQGNGSECLRIACCLGIERGIEICAPVHDAVLICAPLDRLEADVALMRACMVEASRLVLVGFELFTDAKFVRYPDRYVDPRGQVMWERVCKLVLSTDQRQEVLI